MKLKVAIAVVATTALRCLAACVGDTSPPIDSGIDHATGDAAQDTSTQDVVDSSALDAGAETGVTCSSTSPQLFNPVADAGPFCSGAGPGNHCAFGQHCCFNESTLTRVCASSCDAGVTDIACFSKAECQSGLTCCGNGTPDTNSCTYAVVKSFTGTVCASSCASSEYVECAGSVECSGKTCTPAFALNPTNTATSTIQLGACL
jgi:hypothetical protein